MDEVYNESRVPSSIGGLRASTQAQPMRETLMNRELAILDENILRLEDNFSQLARRLVPVLNMQEKPESNSKEPTDPVLPELVDRVKNSRNRISQLASNISQIEQRLEI